MAINFYRQPRVQAPSRTNIVRAQTTPPAPTPPMSADAAERYFERQRAAQGSSPITMSSDITPPPAVDINQIVSDALAGIDFGINLPSVIGGGSSTSSTASNQLLFDQAQAAAQARAAQEAAARARLGVGAQVSALQGLLNTPTGTGSYREGADALLGILAGQETTGRKSIQDQYDAAVKLLGKQYGRAATQTTAGFDALRNYLTANAPQAFAQTVAAPAPTVQNALAQYMQAQGAGSAEQMAAQEVAAQNVAAQAGQGNYAGLLDILRRQETAGQASRLAEQEMARTTAGTALEALQAQAGAGLTRQQQTALDTLVNQLAGQRFGVEQGATERRQSLQDALIPLLGTGFNLTGEQIAEDIEAARVPAVAPSKAPKKVSERDLKSDWQRMVAKKYPNFTGTFNQAKTKYPKLYKQYLDSQKKKK